MPVWDFGQDQERKEPQPPWQQAHGVARGAEDRVDCVAVRAGEVVSVQLALVLYLAHPGPILFRRRISRRIVGEVIPRVWLSVISRPSRLIPWPFQPRSTQARLTAVPVILLAYCGFRSIGGILDETRHIIGSVSLRIGLIA